MHWTNIVIEGFCLCGKDKAPCGRETPSDFCLGYEDEDKCPNFYYSESSERDAAWFVPLYLILWDRFRKYISEFYWTLRWWLWDKWQGFPNYPAWEGSSEWENRERENDAKFSDWFAGVNREKT